LEKKIFRSTFVPGEMAEWSIAAVLKTVELKGSWGSNPYLSADKTRHNWTKDNQIPTKFNCRDFLLHDNQPLTTIHKPKDDKAQSLNCIFCQFATH
jgi:hypothetical protein